MKQFILSILLLVCFGQLGLSQTATGVITQAPCNNDGIYTVTTTGMSLPITYTYYIGTSGNPIVHSNVNSATDQLTNFAMDNSGYIYCFAASAGQNAYAQNSYTPAFSFTTSGTNPLCPVTTGILTATQSGGTTGPFTFSWTNSQTLISYAGNNVSVPVGDYTAIITDQTTGCVLQISDSAANVTQLSNVLGTVSTTQANCTNGTATVFPSGGVAPYTFLWINGATSATISGLSQGYYPVTITDAQGCESNYAGAYIQQNPFISVNTTITNATCIQSDGSASAFASGGVNPYTYTWSNGQTVNTATGLTGPNSYIVIATDANGCIGQGNAFINTNTPITVTYTSTASQCTAPTGIATVTPTGGTAPYTIVWNTSPQATGVTLSNVAPGSYSFTVTDAVGCERTGSAIINPISTITANAQGTAVVCPNTTGTATAIVSGSNPPFNYSWSNGATTNQITGVPLGNYTCLISDALGCTVSKSANVTSFSPVSVSVATTSVSCVFNTDGAANSTVIGGTAPFTYSYTGGTSTPNVTGLGMGNYYLSVTDANGCSKSKHFQIANAQTSTSCYSTISGTVYVDVNSDCILNTGENGVENIMMHCSGYGYIYTDVNGFYSFQVPTGTYTITEQVNAYYPLTPCQSTSTTVSVVAGAGNNTVVDFANNVIIIHDIKLVTMNSNLPPIPGNNYQQKVVVKNMGTVTEGGIQIGYKHDGQIPFLSSTLPSFVQLNSVSEPNHYSVQSGFPSLNPNASNMMLLNYITPTNIPLGTAVNFYDSVADMAPIATSWLLDYTPWNNVNTYQTYVIGSYDPNYKEVTPKGDGPEGLIPSTVMDLDYTIHFQNEGSYFAQNIAVTDQLDADLDWTTLKPGYSDYSYTTAVSETGLVTFKFENINLPWKSQYGDALSSGLINYTISRKASNPQGTEFTNKANIYFDYNAPIETNTTLNTLFDDVANLEEIEGEMGDAITVELYPVPTTDVLTIRISNVKNNEAAMVSIIDLTGNVVLSNNIDLNEGSTTLMQNITSLATGTYLSRIQFSNGSFIVKKIVVNAK